MLLLARVRPMVCVKYCTCNTLYVVWYRMCSLMLSWTCRNVTHTHTHSLNVSTHRAHLYVHWEITPACYWHPCVVFYDRSTPRDIGKLWHVTWTSVSVADTQRDVTVFGRVNMRWCCTTCDALVDQWH